MEYDNETFHVAVKRGDLEQVRNHLAGGLDPMAKNPWSNTTAVDLAVAEIVKAEQLEENQKKVDNAENIAAVFQEILSAIPKQNKEQALALYITNSKAKLLARLADDKTIKNLAVKPHVLFTVASNGYDTSLKLLVEHGANVNAVSNGKPLLICATYAPGVYKAQSRINCATILLEAGANPNAQDIDGNTALFFARDEQVVFELLQRGANAGHVNEYQQGVLVGQVENNTSQPQIIKSLIEAGAGFDGLDVENIAINTDVDKVLVLAWKRHKLAEVAQAQPRVGRVSKPAF